MSANNTTAWNISIDVEKLGPKFTEPLIAIGVFVADDRAKFVSENQFFFLPCDDVKYRDDKPFPRLTSKPDQDTLLWWTSNHPRILEHITKKGKALETEFPLFVNYIDTLLKQAHDKGIQVRYLSDNPNFDLGAIDYHIQALQLRNGVGLKSSIGFQSYYSCEDPFPEVIPQELRSVLTNNAKSTMNFSLLQSHGLDWEKHFGGTHLPLYDAALNFFLFMSSRNICNELMKSHNQLVWSNKS